MGITVQFMRRHVNQLKSGEIFATRDMLGYGGRSAVDQNLRRFVAKGMIERLANGLFMKLSANPLEQVSYPSLMEIAVAKAKAFGKQIISAGSENAAALGVELPEPEYTGEPPTQDEPPTQGEQKIVEFSVNGWSSSFNTVHGRVALKQKANRNFVLGETPVGKTLRGLWHIGEDLLKSTCREVIVSSTIRFDRLQREEMRSRTPQLPSWLSSLLNLPKSDPKPNHGNGVKKRLRRESEFDPRLLEKVAVAAGTVHQGETTRGATAPQAKPTGKATGKATGNPLLAVHRAQTENPEEYAEMLNLLQQLIRK